MSSKRKTAGMTAKRDLADTRARRHLIMLDPPTCPKCGKRLYVVSTQGRTRYLKCRKDRGGCGLTGKLVPTRTGIPGQKSFTVL